jgi:hypothetical protein
MGKEKILFNDIISYTPTRRRAFMALGLSFAALAAACAAGPPDHFAGLLQPQAGTCDPPSRAELNLNNSRVLFTPREGIISLEGALAADGTIRATAVSNGMDRTPYGQTFIGSLTGEKVTGSYTTPRCRYAVTLSAAPR